MVNAVSTHRIENVTQTVWVRLPDVSADFVRRLRRLYTKAIHHSLLLVEKENASSRQIYSKLRANQCYSKLSANMLDRAIREAMLWKFRREQERILTDKTLQRWVNWGKNKTSPFLN